MPSLVILLVVVGAATCDSRGRFLRTSPQDYGQPEVGFAPSARGARSYVTRYPASRPATGPSTLPRSYAPSSLYVVAESASSGYAPSPSAYSRPERPYQSAQAYHAPLATPDSYRTQDPEPIYSPVVAYDVSKRSSGKYSQVAYAPSTPVHYAPSVTRFSSPPHSDRYAAPVAIVKLIREDNFDGTFSFGFEGANGIASSASGYVKAVGPKEQAQVMQGSYSYTAPDGTPILTRWFADETGFHAEGAHLPVAN